MRGKTVANAPQTPDPRTPNPSCLILPIIKCWALLFRCARLTLPEKRGRKNSQLKLPLMKPETASRAAPAPPSTAHNASIAFGRPSRQQDEFRRSQEDSEKESPTPLFSGKERPRRRQEERRRREERGDVRQSPSLWRKAHIINKFMSLASPSSRRRRLLNSDARTTAATTTTATTKMPLIPRRDFTGFNTMSRRRTWRRQGTNELTGIMNREAIKVRPSTCSGRVSCCCFVPDTIADKLT